MSKLLDAIRRDPDAVFEIEATLLSGNMMRGTVGPMINGCVCWVCRFSINPPSDADIAHARLMTDELMGCPAEFERVSYTQQEYEAAAAALRGFMGGGMG